MPSNPGEGDAYRALKDLLLFTDIPALQRQRMIKAIEDTYPSLLAEAAKVRARLTKQGNGPKYEVFYNVKPIVEHVQNNATRAEQLSKVDLTHITVTAVRLSTLMRSVDLSNTTSGLFEYDNRYYLRYVDKNGKKKTQVIAGATLKLVTAHLHSARATPALHLIRHVNNDALCTRAHRLAKFSVQVMETFGVSITPDFRGLPLRDPAPDVGGVVCARHIVRNQLEAVLLRDLVQLPHQIVQSEDPAPHLQDVVVKDHRVCE